jgi:hypothetical protein
VSHLPEVWPATHRELGDSVLGTLCFRPKPYARAIVSRLPVAFYHQDSDRMLLRNVGTYRPGCTASHVRSNSNRHNNAGITSDLTYSKHSSIPRRCDWSAVECNGVVPLRTLLVWPAVYSPIAVQIGRRSGTAYGTVQPSKTLAHSPKLPPINTPKLRPSKHQNTRPLTKTLSHSPKHSPTHQNTLPLTKTLAHSSKLQPIHTSKLSPPKHQNTRPHTGQSTCPHTETLAQSPKLQPIHRPKFSPSKHQTTRP